MLRRLLFVCKTVFSLETYALEESQTLFRMHVCKIISWFVLAEVRAEGVRGGAESAPADRQGERRLLALLAGWPSALLRLCARAGWLLAGRCRYLG